MPTMRDSKEEKASFAKEKAKVVVIVGPTGAGKSRLAIEIAQHFRAEIINADCMQVYEGLDILTNKIDDMKGVPHHLLGIINPNVEFTSKDFRDMAIPIIDSIISCKRLPIIVGGSNCYIQALVSSYMIDDLIYGEDKDHKRTQRPQNVCIGAGKGCYTKKGCSGEVCNASNPFDRLKEIDPVAASRLHPNDVQRIDLYLDFFEKTRILPSKLFQDEKSEMWGRADSFRYDCCFLCVDASLPVLDKHVEQRVDSMIDAGLLKEVSEFYDVKPDYTLGLGQAIGVQEFEKFFTAFPPNSKSAVFPGTEPTTCGSNADSLNTHFDAKTLAASKETIDCQEIFEGSKISYEILLNDAIKRMKANSCKLVREQRRRLYLLKTFFGWNLHQFDVTNALETTGCMLHICHLTAIILVILSYCRLKYVYNIGSFFFVLNNFVFLWNFISIL